MKIPMKSMSGRIPEYKTHGAAGFDLSAYLPDGPITLKPGDIHLVPTGLYMEVPFGYEAQVRARSGLAMKQGITLINGNGTVDSDYRGEWKVPLINLGKEEFILNDGDRMAQVIISKYEKVEFTLVDKLSETDRGESGFGGTGI